MEFLKLFKTENNYLTYRNDKDKYLKPNVSLCEDKGGIYYNYSPPTVYEYVDLGLPSGTKWATMNVGASKPSDYGLYFQWGDTQGYTADHIGEGDGKKMFSGDWADYKWNPSADGKTFTKYMKLGDKLDLEDDAAHVHMGGDWHMPTPDQIEELIRETTTAFTMSDGVSGMTFTSKKDKTKTLFIPAAGSVLDGKVEYNGSDGYIWSCMLNREDGISEDGTIEEGFGIDGAENLSFSTETTEEVTSFASVSPGESETPTIDPGAASGGSPRYFGYSVRGVIGSIS